MYTKSIIQYKAIVTEKNRIDPSTISIQQLHHFKTISKSNTKDIDILWVMADRGSVTVT